MATASNGKATVIQSAFLVIALASSGLSQQTTASPTAPVFSEFPVIMRQDITAGKTPVGAKVRAELMVATMANGTVIPRGAIFTGEVIESAAKSKTEPSRLSVAFDSAQWKNGSTPLKIYLTAWYYPEMAMTNPDISYQPQDASNNKRTWNGQGTYPDPGNPIAQQKFPGRDSGKDSGKDASDGPLTPASSISKHRTLEKHMESSHNDDGVVTLSSSAKNIKIDRLTTYVLATNDLLTTN